MLYKSIFARGPCYGIDGSKIAYQNAVINIIFARIGLTCISFGIMFQIIAVVIPLFITIWLLSFKDFLWNRVNNTYFFHSYIEN